MKATPATAKTTHRAVDVEADPCSLEKEGVDVEEAASAGAGEAAGEGGVSAVRHAQ